MSAILRNTAHATPRKSLDVPLRVAKAKLPDQDDVTGVAFECIEAMQGIHKKSNEEMADLLKVAASNYSRRAYNVARVNLLSLDMRQTFAKCFAASVGLTAGVPTPQAQLKGAAKCAIHKLLDLMESS